MPRFYEPEYDADGPIAAIAPHARRRARDDRAVRDRRPRRHPAADAPIVPFVESVHDRIAIEIMRGCPWQCRFCQSTVIKRPLRIATVETIVQAALESYRNTGLRRDQLSLALAPATIPTSRSWSTRMQRGLHAAGREDLAAQPAGQRDAQERGGAD